LGRKSAARQNPCRWEALGLRSVAHHVDDAVGVERVIRLRSKEREQGWGSLALV
jgi:hypothetical protein